MVCTSVSSFAHEVRPAYLQIDEISPGNYSILWRTPVLSGMRLPVVLDFPPGVEATTEEINDLVGARVERMSVRTNERDLVGQRIEFLGLQATITDVLVRVSLLGRGTTTTLVRPSEPWLEISPAPGLLSVGAVYVEHGVHHILFGWDHLLFVFALLLIVRDRRSLVVTITAFTVAHSITLALAVLGIVQIWIPPVEAVIALSIVLLANEIVRRDRGESGITARWPWVVAFVFGLLHGFGFASALTETGIPEGDVPVALFAFNVGVELGQLGFVAAVLVALAALRRLALPRPLRDLALPATSYAIGTVAAFWFIARGGLLRAM